MFHNESERQRLAVPLKIAATTANQDLQIFNQQPIINQDSGMLVPEPLEIPLKKKIVRKTREDGFFRTGVEVIENEEIDIEQTAHAAADLLKI